MSEWQVIFPGPIIAGVGSIGHLGQEMRKMKVARPFLVTGLQIEEAGLLGPVLESVQKVGLEVVLFQESNLNPTDNDIVEGAKRYHKENCDSIIALGGGSRMDAAKGIRLMTTHSGDLEQYYFDTGGAERITPDMPPLVSIPTTAGSGSEVSRGAVIVDTNQKRKRLLAGRNMMSSLAILDPRLTVSMPPELTAATGMDAFSHALETFVGTNFNPLAENLSRQAATIVCTSLPKAMEDGRDLNMRMQMLLASAMGALSFPKGLGVVHSLAHQILDIPHGVAISILLPYGMEFNIDTCKEKYADLAFAMGVVPRNASTQEAAYSMIEVVKGFAQQFDLPRTLSAVGVERDDLPRMASNAMLDHCHKTNPRQCTEENMLELLERAF